MRRDLSASAFLSQGAPGSLAVKEPVSADELWPSLSGPTDTAGSGLTQALSLSSLGRYSYLHLLQRLFSHDLNSKGLLLQRPRILKLQNMENRAHAVKGGEN